MKFKYLRASVLILAVLAMVIFYILVSGCTKTVYVPVETTKIEYRDRLLRDSVMRYDSIYIKEVLKGDTVRIDIEKYKYLYRDKVIRDSVLINDTIRIPLPVERKLSKWESTKMDIGGWAIGVASCLLLLGIIYIIIWLKKR